MWLQFRNPWEIERPEFKQTIKYYGKTMCVKDHDGTTRFRWIDTIDVLAIPYDIPIPGFGVNNVNTLRLWSARARRSLTFRSLTRATISAPANRN